MTSRFRVAAVLARLEELGVSARRRSLRDGRACRRPGCARSASCSTPSSSSPSGRRSARSAAIRPIGLRLGSEDAVERYDPIAIAALSASSFRDALRARWRATSSSPARRRSASSARGERVRACSSTGCSRREPEPRRAASTSASRGCWHIGRRGTGTRCRPERVELSRAPAHRGLYEAHFGCPVEFEAAAQRARVRAADLERPFLTHNADLLAMVAPQLEAELPQRRAGGDRAASR